MPRVSVILPTYNRADLIGDAIASVQSQTFRDFEIIVADDGSTDNTAAVVVAFGRAITYLRLPHRGQPAATRNAGLRQARGEFVAFLDSDDLFLPNKLARQVDALSSQPETGMVYSNGIFFRDTPDAPTGRVLDGLPTPSGNVFGELLRGNFLAPPVVLIRRACLDAAGEFDERPNFFGVEDFDLWLRIAARFQVQYVPGDVAAIRRHSQGISRDVAALRTRAVRVLVEMELLYPELMREHRAARHEAYARNHGAIAAAELQQWHLLSGASHGLAALSHTLRMPGLGSSAFAAWWKRRALRRGARA
ncbi:MAG: glycosyltransferase [Chloroflexota bacterium]|nr:glycosyltransferase [Chloroflexota bacterium]